METRPVDAEPEPTIPAKMGITTFVKQVGEACFNMMASAKSAKSGTMMSTKLFYRQSQTAQPLVRLHLPIFVSILLF